MVAMPRTAVSTRPTGRAAVVSTSKGGSGRPEAALETTAHRPSKSSRVKVRAALASASRRRSPPVPTDQHQVPLQNGDGAGYGRSTGMPISREG